MLTKIKTDFGHEDFLILLMEHIGQDMERVKQHEFFWTGGTAALFGAIVALPAHTPAQKIFSSFCAVVVGAIGWFVQNRMNSDLDDFRKRWKSLNSYMSPKWQEIAHERREGSSGKASRQNWSMLFKGFPIAVAVLVLIRLWVD